MKHVINMQGSTFKTARLVLGITAGIGAGVLATGLMRAIPVGELRKYQKIGVWVAGLSISWAASDQMAKITKSQVDDVAMAVNAIATGVVETKATNDARKKQV